MGRVAAVIAIALCVGCTSQEPEPQLPEPASAQGIPITIVNEDDEAAEIEIGIYNAATGQQRPALAPFELAPGETTTLNFESTRGRDHAFSLKINGFGALSSDFADCGEAPVEPELPASLTITVLPNGEPATCPWVEG